MQTIPEIDKVIHQPVRTKILALLANMGECDYVTVRDTLSITDGHMTTHMRELIGNEYVAVKKQFMNNKPKTTYRLSPRGKERFKKYLKNLTELVA